MRCLVVHFALLQVRAEEESKHGPMLYGFLETPPLDVLTTWSESRNVSVPLNFHQAGLTYYFSLICESLNSGVILGTLTVQEWVYFLNKGSEIEISYDVKSHGSFPLILVIAEGDYGLAH